MTWTIPLTDVVIEPEDLDAVAECLRSGWLTMGPRTKAFEDAVAEFTGSRYAVAVSSGTAALHLACAAVGLKPGDEVIVPAFTFLATANAPRYLGATPVLADVVSPHAPSLDPEDVQRRITDRTRAVIAVHMCGYPADLDALATICDDHSLDLIVDSAQGFGIDPEDEITCLSFFSKKQLAVGEGGMVLTSDEAVAAKVRLLRSHAMTSGTWDRHRGHEDSYDVVDIGFNFRLDEPRAALGLSRLKRVPAEIERRREAVRAYRERLGEFAMWDDVETATHFAFTVLFDSVETRIAVRDALAQDRIQTTRYPALHHLTEFARYGHDLPNAEQAALRHLALPLSAYTTTEQVERVSQVVLAATARASSRTRP